MKADVCTTFFEKIVFSGSSFPILKEIDTKQAQKVLPPSLSIIAYGDKKRVEQLSFRMFGNGHWPVTFLNGVQHLLSLSKSTIMTPTTLWTRKTLCAYNVLFFQQVILLARRRIITEIVGCLRTAITEF